MSTFPETSHVLFLEELLADGRLPDDLWTALGVAPDLAPRDQDHAVNQSPGAPPVLSDEILGTLGAYFEKSNRALSASSRTGTALVNEAYRGARRDGRE